MLSPRCYIVFLELSFCHKNQQILPLSLHVLETIEMRIWSILCMTPFEVFFAVSNGQDVQEAMNTGELASFMEAMGISTDDVWTDGRWDTCKVGKDVKNAVLSVTVPFHNGRGLTQTPNCCLCRICWSLRFLWHETRVWLCSCWWLQTLQSYPCTQRICPLLLQDTLHASWFWQEWQDRSRWVCFRLHAATWPGKEPAASKDELWEQAPGLE